MSLANLCPPGCNGFHGNPNANVTFLDKDRIFDPAINPKYANDLGLPSLLLLENSPKGITHLHAGPEFGGKHVHNGLSCGELDTMVMEVGARKIQGKTAGARWFGEGSRYNRQGLPSNESQFSVNDQIISTTCAGMNTIREIVGKNSRIKKAIVMTSSDELVQSVKHLFHYTKYGFPDTMPQGHFEMCLGLLRGHLQDLDAKGIEVKFWKVAPEFICGATFQSECALLDHFNIPPTGNADTCTCRKCMDIKQLAELRFARDGHPCQKDSHGIQVATKYGKLKKGEKFLITNNADVNTPNVVMQIDAKGMVFCSDGTAKHKG